MACGGGCGGTAKLRKPNTNNNNQKAMQADVKVYNSSAPVVSFQRSQNITVKRTKV